MAPQNKGVSSHVGGARRGVLVQSGHAGGGDIPAELVAFQRKRDATVDLPAHILAHLQLCQPRDGAVVEVPLPFARILLVGGWWWWPRWWVVIAAMMVMVTLVVTSICLQSYDPPDAHRYMHATGRSELPMALSWIPSLSESHV